MILNGEIDLGFITHPSSSPLIIYEHCRKDALFAFGLRRHFSHAHLTLDELSTTPLVLCTSRLLHEETQILLKAFTKKSLKPNLVMHCDSPESLKAAVKMGIGVGFLYQDAIDPEMRRGDVMSATVPELDLRADTVVTYLKDRPLTPYAQSFLALLQGSSAKLNLLYKLIWPLALLAS
jgi:DNA-binding transcriptional LysR family regulator